MWLIMLFPSRTANHNDGEKAEIFVTMIASSALRYLAKPGHGRCVGGKSTTCRQVFLLLHAIYIPFGRSQGETGCQRFDIQE